MQNMQNMSICIFWGAGLRLWQGQEADALVVLAWPTVSMQNMSNLNNMQNINAKNMLFKDLLSNSHAEMLLQFFINSRRMKGHSLKN